MTSEALTEARAHYDQVEAAMRRVGSLYPENADLINNARIEQVVQRVLDATTGDRSGSDAHLLIAASERVVVLPPEAAGEAAVRAAGPRLCPCDYCGGHEGPPAALLPVAVAPQVVVLALCWTCVALLDQDQPSCRFAFPDPLPDHPERNQG